MKPIVLLESEESVIRDVTCSLKLVDIPVLSSWDISEARRMALESRPELVLARARIKDDGLAGVSLARALSGEGPAGGFPVVVLCTPSERGLIEEHRRLFVSEIALPVEFPAFTQQVQKIISGLKSEGTPQEATRPAAALLTECESPCSGVFGSNMLLAYDIQHKVIEALRGEPRTGEIQAAQMLELICEMTQRVCGGEEGRRKVR